jgi:glutaredoxin
MEFRPMHHVRSHLLTALFGLAAATLLAPGAGAQQVYRIVGADGRVTFSDKPPLDPQAKLAPTVPLAGAARGAAATGAALPFELQQVASKYPVTLYTGSNCGACGSGRAYLTSRGIPFTEKTITTAEDADALKRMTGEGVVPMLTIGGQQVRGYSDSEWGQFLDAAGYPARSALPSSWRNPPAAPLVAVQRAQPKPVPAAADEPSTANTPSPAPAESANNPAGIKF